MKLQQAVDMWVAHHQQQMEQWFRHLHRHPELSHHEHATTAFIADTLTQAGMQPKLLAETGVIVDIGPSEGPRVAFRGDIDALPVAEHTGLEYASTVEGVMHACGHDAHTSIILGLACALKANEHLLATPVRCIFQPAEEVMTGGAPDVVAQGALDNVSSIFAVHAEPKLKVGQIGVKVGPITSAADVVKITVRGPGGHTSRPHMSADVVYALGLIATQLPALLSRKIDPRTGTVVVFGHIEAGNAPNAIPDTGYLEGTIRTANMGVWRMAQPMMEELIHALVAPTGCSVDIDYLRGVPPVINDDTATALLVDAARAVDPHCVQEATQSSGGEDFSWYLEHVPGSMARLGCWDGVGVAPDLHRSNLVVDPRCLGVGVRLFGGIADRIASTDAHPPSAHTGR